MKIKSLIALSAVLIIVAIIVILLQRRYIHQEKKVISNLKENEKLLEDNLFKQYQSEGILLVPETQLFFMKDTCLLTDIVKKGTKLIFRFTELSCMKCVDEEIAFIRASMNYINMEDIVILCTFEHMRDAFLFKTINNFSDISVYLIKENALGIPLEKDQTSYFFTLDSNLITRNIFIPDAYNTSLLKRYFREINKLL